MSGAGACPSWRRQVAPAGWRRPEPFRWLRRNGLTENGAVEVPTLNPGCAKEELASEEPT